MTVKKDSGRRPLSFVGLPFNGSGIEKESGRIKDREITVTGKKKHFKSHTYLGEELVTVEVLQYTNEREDIIIEEQ